MKKYAVGVDVGGTAVKMGIFDTEGNILEKWEIPTVTKGGPDAIFANIAGSIKQVCEKLSIRKEEILGIGMGVPASVKPDGFMAKAINVGWDEMYPAQELEKLLDIPVKAANDANAAAFGEMWKGAAKGYKNVAMVTLGTGVGGGIISGGKILIGSTGGGGEIGHIHVDDQETEKCNCGNYGCLEQYASATGIVRLAKKRLAKDEKSSILRGVQFSAKDVFDAAKKEDAVAKEVVGTFGEYLAKGMGIMCSVVNPEAVVFGGGVSKAGDMIVKSVEPHFHKYVFPPCGKVKFMMAKLENDGGICGAAGLILNSETDGG